MDFETLLDIVNRYKDASKIINNLNLDDSQAYQVRILYPKWKNMIGKSLGIGMRVRYENRLYRVISPIPVVEEDQYPSTHTTNLYEQILN